MPEEEYLLTFVLRVNLVKSRLQEEGQYLSTVNTQVVPSSPRYSLLRAVGEDIIRQMARLDRRLEEYKALAQSGVL